VILFDPLSLRPFFDEAFTFDLFSRDRLGADSGFFVFLVGICVVEAGEARFPRCFDWGFDVVDEELCNTVCVAISSCSRRARPDNVYDVSPLATSWFLFNLLFACPTF
jgi:hypothetical protein